VSSQNRFSYTMILYYWIQIKYHLLGLLFFCFCFFDFWYPEYYWQFTLHQSPEIFKVFHPSVPLRVQYISTAPKLFMKKLKQYGYNMPYWPLWVITDNNSDFSTRNKILNGQMIVWLIMIINNIYINFTSPTLILVSGDLCRLLGVTTHSLNTSDLHLRRFKRARSWWK